MKQAILVLFLAFAGCRMIFPPLPPTQTPLDYTKPNSGGPTPEGSPPPIPSVTHVIQSATPTNVALFPSPTSLLSAEDREREWDKAVMGILEEATRGQTITIRNALITRVTRPVPGEAVANISVIESIDFQSRQTESSVLAIARHAECVYQAYRSQLIESGPRGFYVLNQRVPQILGRAEVPLTSFVPAVLVLVSITADPQTVTCS